MTEFDFDLPFRLARRRLLTGGVGLFGLTSTRLEHLRALAADSEAPALQRANACVFVFLFGGPSHIDLWDMKPLAPLEIRGEFRPLATRVPGIELCEHLPLLAQQTQHLCLVRSMTHHMPVHGPACSEVYTGREYFGPPVTDQATPEDWPSIAAHVARFGRCDGPLPASVVLPWYTQFEGQQRRIAGQTGGRMGEEFNPFLVEGDPTEADFRFRELELPPELPPVRIRHRIDLLDALRPDPGRSGSCRQARDLDRHYQTAAAMLERAEASGAFDLRRESDALRDGYGRTMFGQSLLLARRLVEAGVSLVTVNWRDTHDDKVSPHWDTHVENFPKLKDRLCPPFDRGFSTFLSDLHQRGLLETTLVVALGEFGRTPRIGVVTQNGMTEKTGRDHWPHAFTALLAGGGIRGGQVIGSTVANGGYVKDSPVTPADLAATVLEHLGIDPSLEYDDRVQNVRRKLAVGRPLRELSGRA